MPKHLTIEQLQEQKARAHTRAEAAKRQQRRIDAQMRAMQRETDQKRRMRWASIAEQVGLFQLEDVTLQEVLTVALAMVKRHGGRLPSTTDDHGTGLAELRGVTMLVLECARGGDNGTPPEPGDRLAGSVES
jgi:hypothetical protein